MLNKRMVIILGFSNKKGRGLVAGSLAITAVAPQVVSAQNSALEKVKKVFVDFWVRFIFFNWYKKDLLKKAEILLNAEEREKTRLVKLGLSELEKFIEEDVREINSKLKELAKGAGLDSIEVKLREDFTKGGTFDCTSEKYREDCRGCLNSGYLSKRACDFIEKVLNKRDEYQKEIKDNESKYLSVEKYIDLSNLIKRIDEIKEFLKDCASVNSKHNKSEDLFWSFKNVVESEDIKISELIERLYTDNQKIKDLKSSFSINSYYDFDFNELCGEDEQKAQKLKTDLGKRAKELENTIKNLKNELCSPEKQTSDFLKEKGYFKNSDNFDKSVQNFFDEYVSKKNFVKSCNEKARIVFTLAQGVAERSEYNSNFDYSKISKKGQFHYRNVEECCTNLADEKEKFEKAKDVLEKVKKSGFIFSGTSEDLIENKSFIDNYKEPMSEIFETDKL